MCGTRSELCSAGGLVSACNETNLMHYLSSVYSVTIPLHVSGLLVVHHQEIAMYMCDEWYVLCFLVECRRTGRNGIPFQPGLNHVEVY
jgi:hypothetical protein